MPMMIASLLATMALALVHVFSPKLGFLDRVPQTRWLSFGGGVAVSLVFLEIIPELGDLQREVERALGPFFGFLRNHIYLLALLGLAVYYTVQRHVKRSRQQRRRATGEDRASRMMFWIDISVVGTKNAIVGYLLTNPERSFWALLLFFLAIGMEFTIGDRGLHADHKQDYDSLGRWILVTAVFLGWTLGYVTEIPEIGIGILNAFLAGYIILNVLKNELPQDQQSSIGAF